MQPTPATRYRFTIAAAILLLQFAMGLNFLAVAPLFPLIVETYTIDRATVSLLVGATNLVLALAFVPCSILAAQIRPRLALAIGGLLMSTLMFAPVAGNFWLLLLTRLAFAVGATINMTTASGIIMRWFPARELPLVNGLNVIGQSLGVTISMMVGIPIASAFGWQGTVAVFGAVALLGTLVWLVAGKDGDTAATPGGSGLSFQEFRHVLGQRAALILGLGIAGGIAQNITFGSWLPSYYHDTWDFPLEKAANVGALFSFMGIAGSLLGSVLPFRVGLRRPFLILPGLLAPVVGLGCFMTDEPMILYPAVALTGILGWLFFPVAFTIPMELPGMTPKLVGITVAVVLGIGNLSGFVMPFVVGFLRDQTGSFWPGFFIASTAAFSLLAAGLLLPETGPKASRGQPHSTPSGR